MNETISDYLIRYIQENRDHIDSVRSVMGVTITASFEGFTTIDFHTCGPKFSGLISMKRSPDHPHPLEPRSDKPQ